MKRQRGFGLVELGIVLAITAVLAGIVYGVTEFIEGVRKDGYDAGHADALLAVANRDNVHLLKANKRITELQEAARGAEALHAKNMAALDARHNREKENAKARRDRDVAAARDGGLVLRYATSGPADRGCADGGGGGTPAPGAGAGGGDGATTTELPREIAANLLGLANDADEIVGQLTACQQIVADDRR